MAVSMVVAIDEVSLNENKVFIALNNGQVRERKIYKQHGKLLFTHKNKIYILTKENEEDGNNFNWTFSYLKENQQRKGTAIIPTVEVNNNDDVVLLDKEAKHAKYDMIRSCILEKIPVYLAGPAGSGKNYTLEEIANELDMNFYSTNAVQQEYKLTGFIDANGTYHETEFFKACVDERDCIFFLDEMDASIPEVLTLLNAAIANGYFEFPTGRINLEHVHFVSAGNTTGSGADDKYTGRMMIDAATLDRFVIIEYDYDLNVELHITKGNSQLVSFIRQLRDEADSKGIRATFSYRCMIYMCKLEKTGMQLSDILRITVVKGMDNDTIRTLRPQGVTKYHIALQHIQG